MPIQLTIIGLGQIGASIGLALRTPSTSGKQKQPTNQIKCIGTDTSIEIGHKAERIGAIDKYIFTLPKAVENANIVVLAVPVDEVRTTLEQIASYLQPGSVVLDTSPVKRSVTQWAEELLPEDRHFVSFTPALSPHYMEETTSGIDAAHADLFQNSIISITTPTGTDPDAIKLGADLASLLGAKALFSDPTESDSLTAAGVQLPKLLAAALLNATLDEPGWAEGRKVAWRDYAIATGAILRLDENETLGQSLILNKDNVVRVIDNLIRSLYDLHDAISDSDQAKLKELLDHAQKGRIAWLEQRLKADWEAVSREASDIPSSGEHLSNLFLGGLGRRQPKK